MYGCSTAVQGGLSLNNEDPPSTLDGTQLAGREHKAFAAVVAPPMGNRPEWMCLDSNLNADWERWTKHLCAFTSDLDFKDARWCGLGTPKQVAATMRLAWASIPELRIRQDVLRYPSALQAVVDASPPGGMPAIVTRRGRRSTLMLPTPPGMDDIAAAREQKFDEWLRGTGGGTDAVAEGYPTVVSALEGVELDSDGEEGDMHLGEELDEEELERDLAGESPNDEDEAVMDLS